MTLPVRCSFKLVYTNIIFYDDINFTVTPYQFKKQIESKVFDYMNIIDFNIILAGTELKENNEPIDCTNNLIPLSSLISKKFHAFYIKKANIDYN